MQWRATSEGNLSGIGNAGATGTIEKDTSSHMIPGCTMDLVPFIIVVHQTAPESTPRQSHLSKGMLDRRELGPSLCADSQKMTVIQLQTQRPERSHPTLL